MKKKVYKIFILLFLLSLLLFLACSEPNSYEPYTYTKKYWNIHIMNVDGSNMVNLTKSEDFYYLGNISPLGTKIIYNAESGGGHTMNLDGSNKIPLVNGFRQFSPDETKILYTSHIGERVVLNIMNVNGTNVMSIDTAARYGNSANFSPDGTKLVYTSNDSIFTINIDGSNKVYFTTGSYPQYTSDGSNIVYFNQGLRRMNGDGSNITTITDDAAIPFNFIISPDGLKIAYSISTDPVITNYFDLCIIDIDGNNKKVLTDLQSFLFFSEFKFSPDGTKIIYDHYENVNGDIYEINIDGSNKKNLSTHIFGDCVIPIYTKDGSKIIFQKWSDVQNE